MQLRHVFLLLGFTAWAGVAAAQTIEVGISATLTGPNAANGVPYRKRCGGLP